MSLVKYRGIPGLDRGFNKIRINVLTFLDKISFYFIKIEGKIIEQYRFLLTVTSNE